MVVVHFLLNLGVVSIVTGTFIVKQGDFLFLWLNLVILCYEVTLTLRASARLMLKRGSMCRCQIGKGGWAG
jgi:hypothetical protein